MFVYNILIMKTPITDNKGKKVLTSTPVLDKSWLNTLSNTLFIFGIEKKANACKGKDLDLFFGLNTELADSENNTNEKTIHQVSPVANNECFTVYTSIGNAEQLEKQYNDAFKKAFPLTPDECFKKK